MSDIRQKAEEHWKFIENLLKAHREHPEYPLLTVNIETCHYLFIEAMVHGYKHKSEEQKP